MTFTRRWDGTGPGIISGFYGDVYVDKDGFITEAPYQPPITRPEFVRVVNTDEEEHYVMGFHKYGTGEVLGEDKPKDEDETPYEFVQPEGERLPTEIRTQRADGSTGPTDSER